MRKFALLLVAGLFAGFPARADIERKVTIDCEKNQICFYIWPKLPELPGWHQDEAASFKYRGYILAPDGTDFVHAASVLSGNAVPVEGYQTDHPGPHAVDSFIADDAVTTRKHSPNVEIAEQEALVTADGVKMRTFVMHKLGNGDSQLVAFGEDGDKDGRFFIVLMLDSTTRENFDANVPVFKEMVGKYKHYSGGK